MLVYDRPQWTENKEKRAENNRHNNLSPAIVGPIECSQCFLGKPLVLAICVPDERVYVTHINSHRLKQSAGELPGRSGERPH